MLILLKNNKLYKNDKIFSGLINGIKNTYESTIDGYLTFFEICMKKHICLHENELEYLNNIVSHKIVNKKSVKETEMQRAIKLLQEQEAA